MKKYMPIVKLGGILCNNCRVVIKSHYSEEEASGETGPVLCNKCLEKLIYNYKTTYKEGFTSKEIQALITKFPTLKKDKFFDSLNGITCMVREGNIITYHCDIISALKCGLENRNLTIDEWD